MAEAIVVGSVIVLIVLICQVADVFRAKYLGRQDDDE
jgi:hypothetical protein